MQSYHRAMTLRLQGLSEQPLETCDVYFLLDFLHNIYTRYTHLRVWFSTGTGKGISTGTGSRIWTRIRTETWTRTRTKNKL